MISFKFFIGQFNIGEPQIDGIRLCASIFVNNLITSGEYETTIYPKVYRFFGYSILVHSIISGMKINDEGFTPYVEHYHNIDVTYKSNDETFQRNYQFSI